MKDLKSLVKNTGIPQPSCCCFSLRSSCAFIVWKACLTFFISMKQDWVIMPGVWLITEPTGISMYALLPSEFYGGQSPLYTYLLALLIRTVGQGNLSLTLLKIPAVLASLLLFLSGPKVSVWCSMIKMEYCCCFPVGSLPLLYHVRPFCPGL